MRLIKPNELNGVLDKYVANSEQFNHVIFVDECNVQLEEKTSPAVLKAKIEASHWGAHLGRNIPMWHNQDCYFSDIMNAVHYGEVLSSSLLPFIRECYHEGHRLYNRTMTQSIQTGTLRIFCWQWSQLVEETSRISRSRPLRMFGDLSSSFAELV